jgi:hypothetical protein
LEALALRYNAADKFFVIQSAAFNFYIENGFPSRSTACNGGQSVRNKFGADFSTGDFVRFPK